MSLETSLKLHISEEHGEEQEIRTYSLEDLRELQNKLMLMSGKGDQSEVNRFSEVYLNSISKKRFQILLVMLLCPYLTRRNILIFSVIIEHFVFIFLGFRQCPEIGCGIHCPVYSWEPPVPKLESQHQL